MKVSILGLAAGMALLAVATSDTVIESNNNSAELIACGWFPLCGDPDIYNPMIEPKDSKSKTDSKDNKNDKNAKLA
ncbi:hypothetical protein [Rheinheimera metallidurans]|uniref:hypothetical protein n=1 Tax=Rheinheimera metallidurans TaxID=2925781 RepID=UPI003002776A